MQTLKFRDEEHYRLIWETDDEGNVTTCTYVCEQGCEIEEHHKDWMLNPENGAEWIAEFPDRKIITCHINALYSPWFHWHEVAARFIEANKAIKEGKPELLKTFINTILGETWDTNQEGSDVKGLENRAEAYEAEVPLGVLVITAGCDVQPDRIECEIIGWGIGEESWSLNYFVLPGDTDKQQVWSELFEVLTKDFECEREDSTGTRVTRTIDAVCIDSGGHNTQAVYGFTRQHHGRKFLAIKGISSGGKEAISKRPTKLKAGVLLYLVGTNIIKDKLFGQFKVEEPGPGYCHFPVGYDEEHYKQLGAEKRVKKLKKFDKNDPHGYSQYSYKKIRSRNEALDCRVYGIAALEHLNPNFPALLAEENLQCAPKIDTMYIDENFVAENNQRKSGRRFGQMQGFVSSWNKRS
jgi:phage terminase large subunit GpA-like protein